MGRREGGKVEWTEFVFFGLFDFCVIDASYSQKGGLETKHVLVIDSYHIISKLLGFVDMYIF